MSDQNFVARNSLVIFFVLAFSISWIGTFAIAGPKSLAGEDFESSDIGLMAVAMLSGPFFAGLIMSYVADGRSGFLGLFAKMKKIKVAGRWYLPVLIFPALLLLVSFLLGVFVSPELAPVLGFFGVVGGPMAGFLEETGWMGFAYPKIKAKRSALSAALYFGSIHIVWHVLADFLVNFTAFGGYWLPYFIGFSLHIIPLRVLTVWVYTNTKSLPLAMLMHASSTGFYGILISTTMAPINWVIFYNVYGVALFLVAAVVPLKYGRTLKAQT